MFEIYTEEDIHIITIFRIQSTSYEKGIPIGYIVAATCKGGIRDHLSQSAKSWFIAIGSTEIQKVKELQEFVFIGVSGQEGN